MNIKVIVMHRQNRNPFSYPISRGRHQGPTAYLSENAMSGNAQNKRPLPCKRNQLHLRHTLPRN